jgi:hypothetical protein
MRRLLAVLFLLAQVAGAFALAAPAAAMDAACAARAPQAAASCPATAVPCPACVVACAAVPGVVAAARQDISRTDAAFRRPSSGPLPKGVVMPPPGRPPSFA